MEPGQPQSGFGQKPTEEIKDLRNGSAPQPANFEKGTRNTLNKGQPPEQNVLQELDSHMQEIKNQSPIYDLTLYETYSNLSEILMRTKTVRPWEGNMETMFQNIGSAQRQETRHLVKATNLQVS